MDKKIPPWHGTRIMAGFSSDRDPKVLRKIEWLRKRKPDYGHWCAMPTWSLIEAVCLALDFEPPEQRDGEDWGIIHNDPDFSRLNNRLARAIDARDLVPHGRGLLRPWDVMKYLREKGGVKVPKGFDGLPEPKEEPVASPDAARAPDKRGTHWGVKREQVLMAALHALRNFPDECSRGKGPATAAGVYRVIENKSTFYFGNEGGMPLKEDSAKNLISKAFKNPNTPPDLPQERD